MVGSQARPRQLSPEPRRLPPLNTAQIAASEPADHVWLSAPPGTGGRLVVAARIWRLLLAGVAPDAMLFLSLHPAEAAAVSNRVVHRLARWVRANEHEIAADLDAIGADNSPATRARARYLLAQVLDRPGGGLSIQTFQDFALQLLASSPFEAGRIPGLRMLDVREQAEVSSRVFAELQAKAIRGRRSGLVDAIEALICRLGLRNAKRFLQECACHADAMADLPPMIGPWLRSAMGLERGEADPSFASFMEGALEAGREYTHLYTEAKRRIGVCDAEDLLAGALSMIEHPATGEWARFKLDQRTHHLLISGAQDTNWRHWRLVRAITEDFFAGEGASDSVRTLFVCGDAQAAVGAAGPIYYEAAFEHFHRLGNAIGGSYEFGSGRSGDFSLLTLMRSYRSAQSLIEFTRTVMNLLPEPGMGIVEERDQLSIGTNLAGEVVLLSRTPCDHPSNGGSDADTIGTHAERLVGMIQGWLRSADILASTGCQPRPGDVAIFFKKRGRLALDVASRLQAAGIAFADELGLTHTKPPAMIDLLAAARFVLNREDERALSSFIASPLIDVTEHQLDQRARPLAASTDHRGVTLPPKVSAVLDELVYLANTATPHRFFEGMLFGALDGRRKLVSQYGAAALDQIEALLDAALDFERSNPPSLQAFLDEVEQLDSDLGRDSWGEGAVRILGAETVLRRHFPIVILADASECEIAREPRFMTYRPDNRDLEIPIVFPHAGEVSGAFASHMAESERSAVEEDWRLFYVVVSSAVDRLIIAGPATTASGGESDVSWYAACARAFDALGVPDTLGEDRVFEGLGIAYGNPPSGAERRDHVARLSVGASA